jgi:hypothetical protein
MLLGGFEARSIQSQEARSALKIFFELLTSTIYLQFSILFEVPGQDDYLQYLFHQPVL